MLVSLLVALGWVSGSFMAGLGVGYWIARHNHPRPEDAVDCSSKTCAILKQHAEHDGTVVVFTQRGRVVNLRCWAMRGRRYCPLLKARCEFFHG